MKITLMIALYIASVLYMRNWTRIAHSKNGRFSNLDVEFMDFFYAFMPVFNTVVCFLFFCVSPYKNKPYRKPINYNKIFGVKK